jgi:hypothetical protein
VEKILIRRFYFNTIAQTAALMRMRLISNGQLQIQALQPLQKAVRTKRQSKQQALEQLTLRLHFTTAKQLLAKLQLRTHRQA